MPVKMPPKIPWTAAVDVLVMASLGNKTQVEADTLF
jgi:hypothetical protein